MKRLLFAERICLIAHIAAMAFGLAGLLLVLPHPEFILRLPTGGQQLFQWSMAGGGVVYILLGAAAVSLYGYRTIGLQNLLAFMVPAVLFSLGSELLGTSTGFPFGDYAYLNGLGYKIAGLVPFTIPLSWFYLGLSTFLLAHAGLHPQDKNPASTRVKVGAVLLGALLLTSWDFVLDPAMSQTAVPFWEWKQPGPFFGMPYQNFAGWLATGVIFMGVASLLWGGKVKVLTRSQLKLPLAIYISNFAFAAIMSLVAGINLPVLLGIGVGLVPALALWWRAPETVVTPTPVAPTDGVKTLAVNTAP